MLYFHRQLSGLHAGLLFLNTNAAFKGESQRKLRVGILDYAMIKQINLYDLHM